MQSQVGMLFQHWHTVCTHTCTNDHSYNTEKCAHRITSLQDPAKQINKLLIKRGKCDWPLTGRAMIYCTCHHLLKVTLTLRWWDRSAQRLAYVHGDRFSTTLGQVKLFSCPVSRSRMLTCQYVSRKSENAEVAVIWKHVHVSAHTNSSLRPTWPNT